LFDEINQLLPVPHICVRCLELHAGCLVIVAIQHSTNHNHESCIRQLWEDTVRFFASALTQIRRGWLVALPSLLSCLLNLTSTFLQKHLNPLAPNQFGIIQIFQRQPGLESLQKSATAVSQCRGPSRSCFRWFCPWIMDRSFFSRHPATHTLFHLLNMLKLGGPILLANCFKENAVCLKRIGAWASATPKSHELSLS